MPKLLPYDVDDDEAAEQYVREALRRSQRGNWKALIADDRVIQTYRVLRRIESGAAQAHIRHREAIMQAEIDLEVGLISDDEFAECYRAFASWRQRASVFDGILRQYLDMVVDRVRVVRRDPVVDCLRSSLLVLALAVDAHRNAHAGEESLADTALWARLSTLPWPVAAGAEFRTLADAVTAERVRREPARVNSEGLVEFEGHWVFGETVDVADLVLEVADHVEPSISRPKLIELWKQRTPDLLATEAAKVTADRQVGHYASQRLRKALLFLENLGLITRVADDAGPTDRDTTRPGQDHARAVGPIDALGDVAQPQHEQGHVLRRTPPIPPGPGAPAQEQRNSARIGARGQLRAVTPQPHVTQERVRRGDDLQTLVEHRPVPHTGRHHHRKRTHVLPPRPSAVNDYQPRAPHPRRSVANRSPCRVDATSHHIRTTPREAEHKPRQLVAAARASLDVLPSLVTNDGAAVRRFVAGCGPCGAVTKMLGATAICEQGGRRVALTQRLASSDLGDLRGIEVTAHQFQRWASKREEARVIVIGRHLHAVAIRAGSEAAQVDWRADYRSLSYKTVDPPVDVQRGVHAVMGELGLVYGAFDFVITPEGRWVFLEVNPGGQFGWLEDKTDVPLTATLADLLAWEAS